MLRPRSPRRLPLEWRRKRRLINLLLLLLLLLHRKDRKGVERVPSVVGKAGTMLRAAVPVVLVADVVALLSKLKKPATSGKKRSFRSAA